MSRHGYPVICVAQIRGPKSAAHIDQLHGPESGCRHNVIAAKFPRHWHRGLNASTGVHITFRSRLVDSNSSFTNHLTRNTKKKTPRRRSFSPSHIQSRHPHNHTSPQPTPLPTMVRQSSPAKPTRSPPRTILAPLSTPNRTRLTRPVIAVFPPCLVANRRVLGRRLGRRHQPPPLPRLGPRRRPHRHPSPRGRRPEGEARQRPAQQHARRGRRRLQQHHAAPVHGRVARPQGRPGGCVGAVAGVYL